MSEISIDDVKDYLKSREDELKFLKDLTAIMVKDLLKSFEKLDEDNYISELGKAERYKKYDKMLPEALTGANGVGESFNGKLAEIVLDNDTIEFLKRNAIKLDYEIQIKDLSEENIEELKSQGIKNIDEYKVVVYRARDKEKVMESLLDYFKENGINRESFREEMKRYKEKADELNKQKERDKDKNRSQEVSL